MAGLIKRGYLMHLVIAVICALVAFTGSSIFGVTMGAIMYAAYILMMFAEGSARGEHACTVRDIVAKLESEQKRPDKKQLQESWRLKTAIHAAILIAAPFVLLACANLILASSQSASESILGVITRIVFMPAAFITRICSEAVKYNTDGVRQAAAAAVGAFDFGSVNAQGLLSELGNIATYAYASDLSPLTLMRICYIPAAILPALAMLVGYARGPKLRAKTLDDMLKGTRKKQRKLKVFSRSRQTKQAKPQI